MSPFVTRPRPAVSRGKEAKQALLLIDDDPLILDSFTLTLGSDYRMLTARTRPEALRLVRRGKTPPSLVLLDLGLPPTPHEPDEGFSLIRELLANDRSAKILVLSGQGKQSHVRRALTLGAVDFIPKPCDMELLKTRLRHQAWVLEAERSHLGKSDTVQGELLGGSPAMVELRARIEQFAEMPYPVLIEGESGSGKELAALGLHRYGRHKDAPYVKINCAALPADLLESQLFGHVRGAFTGADTDNCGFLDAASEGSLLLDEIGELPSALQSKLLRVMDGGEYFRLGETCPRFLQARILASTNRHLLEEVEAGRFRRDLYHRLSVLTLRVPPLRERGQDRLLLFKHFAELYIVGKTLQLDEEAQALLSGYSFPGNVRELRNLTIRLSARHVAGKVSASDLEPHLESSPRPERASKTELLQEGFRLDETLEETERRWIHTALETAAGNLSQAARLLGLSRTTLYGRMQRLSIREKYGRERAPRPPAARDR